MSDLTWTNQKRKLSDLIPWPRNPRQIDSEQAERLLKSWDKFGQVETLAIGPGNELYDGHQRKKVLSAQLVKYGPDFEVDVRVSSRPLTEIEREELTVLKETAAGGWDWGKFDDWDKEDLLDWGFDESELEAVDWGDDEDEPPDPGPQVDKAEELQEKWGVADGDIWQAGSHFVICGDCREPDTWRRLLSASGTDKVNGIFTSPPYAEQRKQQYGGVPVDEYVEWWEAVQELARANLADDGSFFVNIKPHCEKGERVLYVFDLVLAMRRRWGWRFVDELCWKRVTSPGRWPNRFKNLFEPIYHFSAGDCIFNPTNVLQGFKNNPANYQSYDRKTAKTDRPSGFDTTGSMKSPHFDGALPGNIIEAGGAGGEGHWAAFPIAIPDFFIRAYSDPGDTWIDPFLGSGTTICAAHQAKGGQRVGLGIEQLAKYVSVCLERFVGLGLEPKLIRP